MSGTLLIATSPRWGYVVDGFHALQDLRAIEGDDDGWADALLLHRDRAGIDRCSGRWWRQFGGRTEVVADAGAAVERADLVVAFIAHRDPDPMAVIERAGEVGTPVWLHYLGKYPYPTGSLQGQGREPARWKAQARQRPRSGRRAAA